MTIFWRKLWVSGRGAKPYMENMCKVKRLTEKKNGDRRFVHEWTFRSKITHPLVAVTNKNTAHTKTFDANILKQIHDRSSKHKNFHSKTGTVPTLSSPATIKYHYLLFMILTKKK